MVHYRGQGWRAGNTPLIGRRVTIAGSDLWSPQRRRAANGSAPVLTMAERRCANRSMTSEGAQPKKRIARLSGVTCAMCSCLVVWYVAALSTAAKATPDGAPACLIPLHVNWGRRRVMGVVLRLAVIWAAVLR